MGLVLWLQIMPFFQLERTGSEHRKLNPSGRGAYGCKYHARVAFQTGLTLKFTTDTLDIMCRGAGLADAEPTGLHRCS